MKFYVKAAMNNDRTGKGFFSRYRCDMSKTCQLEGSVKVEVNQVINYRNPTSGNVEQIATSPAKMLIIHKYFHVNGE